MPSSITRAADGSYYVTFEGWHRLWRYRTASDPLRAAAKYVRAPKGMTSLPGNEGVEAATQLPDRRFLLLSEGGFDEGGDLQGWLGDGKRWAALTLAPTGAFRPTDLTTLPGGDVLLLERSVSLFGGFAARLSVIPAATITPGARLAGRELAVIRSPLPVDNFEAAAARAAPDGSVLIYVLSDEVARNSRSSEVPAGRQFRGRGGARRARRLGPDLCPIGRQLQRTDHELPVVANQVVGGARYSDARCQQPRFEIAQILLSAAIGIRYQRVNEDAAAGSLSKRSFDFATVESKDQQLHGTLCAIDGFHERSNAVTRLYDQFHSSAFFPAQI